MIVRHVLYFACFALFFSLLLCPSDSIMCIVGIGQRGLLYSNGIAWTRECPNTKYCFEANSDDVKQMITLFDYPWVSATFIYSSSLLSLTHSLNYLRITRSNRLNSIQQRLSSPPPSSSP